MNFRRWGPALLLLGWTQIAPTPTVPADEPHPVACGVARYAASGEGSVQAKNDAKPKGAPIQIPYRLTNTEHILVRVKINGKGPFNFIIDTGAPIMILATEPAKKLGLEPGKDRFIKYDRVEIEGGAVLEKFPCLIETPFQLEGMNGLGIAGRELHGILGYTVLAKFRMEIDFTKDKMVWTPLDYAPESPKGIGGGGGQGGLEVIGKIYRVLGFFIGKTPDPVARGFIGIELKNEKDAVTVAGVLAKSPADTAGLKVGDQIVEVGSKKVSTASEVLRQTAEATVGRPIVFVVRRGAEKLTISVSAGDGL